MLPILPGCQTPARNFRPSQQKVTAGNFLPNAMLKSHCCQIQGMFTADARIEHHCCQVLANNFLLQKHFQIKVTVASSWLDLAADNFKKSLIGFSAQKA
jgi:hypothetical protein